MGITTGPFETEQEVRDLPAVEAIYDAMRASNRRGVMAERGHRLLDGACEVAGVELGAYDHRIIGWISEWTPEICAVIAGIITRAHEHGAPGAGQPPSGTVKLKLRLEARGQENKTAHIGPIALTPAIDEDYWAFRVRLSETQAIVGFPKFSTIGVGFAQEEDWNTNLPYTCDTEVIFGHIRHNKGDDSIPDDACREAIRMVQAAARVARPAGTDAP